jgi:hypothetical protein
VLRAVSRGSIPDAVIRFTEFSWPHCGAGFDSDSNTNEYQECYVTGECGRCVGLRKMPPSCADSLESR